LGEGQVSIRKRPDWPALFWRWFCDEYEYDHSPDWRWSGV
jgi:hypothetical protein